MFDEGKQLIDMIYFKIEFKGRSWKNEARNPRKS
jgi:hypothetical protein